MTAIEHVSRHKSRYIAIIVAFAFWAAYSSFSTKYTFTEYKIKNCTKIVTAIEYTSVFDRGVIFVSGKYAKHETPTSDCVTVNNQRGFDAYFECIPTCEGEKIVINYNDVLLKNDLSKIMTSKQLDTESYNNLKSQNADYVIRIY